MMVNPRFISAPVLAITLAGSASLGCNSAPPGGSLSSSTRVERTLAASYPAQAARIVEARTPFERRSEGFARAPDRQSPIQRGDPTPGLELTLPLRGDGAIAISAGGLGVHVREIDAKGDGALAGSAVAYPRAGGTSLWSATPEGAEEWLLLDAGVARADRVAAAWEVEGARVREASGVIEILDAEGTPRIRVTAPEAFAEGGRAVHASLSAQGNRIELTVDGGGAPVLADPSWSGTGTMLVQRGYHASTLLPNGKVFVVGGATSGATLSSAEIFDPVTNAWSTAAPMLTARMGPFATLLSNGRVLVTGTMGVPANSAELYNPGTNSWSPAGVMSAPRGNATSTQLDDGRVLVVGGTGMDPLKTAEIYDPSSNSWSAAAPLVAGRSAHTATRLPNGKVLVVSGFDAHGVITTVEIYDPSANAWTAGPSMSTGGGYSTATLLQTGKVLVVGGAAGPGGGIARAEIYDPGSNSWSATKSLTSPRFYHTATLLPTGQVVVAGGMNAFGSLSSTEVYDPNTGTWSGGSALTMGRNAHTATLLPSGLIVAAGGLNVLTGYLNTAESYGPNGTGSGGTSCGSASECASGYCVDGVCCNSACGAGPCDACSVAAGADVNGTCKSFTGPVCDDGNPCTQSDTCQSGACFGANPKSCPAPDECHNPGACSPLSGVCTDSQKPDETPCAIGACVAGVCGPVVTTSAGSGAGGGKGTTSAASGAGASSSTTTVASTSAGAGAGGASATGAGGALGTGGVLGAGGAPSTGSSGGRNASTGSTGPSSDNVACSVGSVVGSTRSAGPFALLLALGALMRVRARKATHRRDPRRS